VIIFQCMSLTRSKYSKLGLELVSLEENHSHTQENLHGGRKENNRTKDSINLFLEQALMRQMDEMMENFSHILQRLSIIVGTFS
jgi:hypothetical protein